MPEMELLTKVPHDLGSILLGLLVLRELRALRSIMGKGLGTIEHALNNIRNVAGEIRAVQQDRAR